MRRLPTSVSSLVFATLIANVSTAQDFDALKKALGDTVTDGWIYEDMDAGYAQAKETGKPLLVSFR